MYYRKTFWSTPFALALPAAAQKHKNPFCLFGFSTRDCGSVRDSTAPLASRLISRSRLSALSPELHCRIAAVRSVIIMPRFFDDYSNTYLTHDSAAGRKQQRRGWKFRENFKVVDRNNIYPLSEQELSEPECLLIFYFVLLTPFFLSVAFFFSFAEYNHECNDIIVIVVGGRAEGSCTTWRTWKIGARDRWVSRPPSRPTSDRVAMPSGK